MRRAVVDVGSNSVLLTVAVGTPGDWTILEETSEVTGLGTDTKKSGLLQPVPQAATLEAIKRAFERAAAHNAECVAVGTMALRIATNAREFLDKAKEQDTPVTVISGDEEARLGLEAVMNDPLFADQSLITVIDPGGHSTELTTAKRTDHGIEVRFQRSVPIGALGLREGAMGAESPDPAARLKAVVEIDDAIAVQYRPNEAGTAVALGATPTNLVTIREAMPEWDPVRVHGQYLDYEEVSKAAAWMCDMTEAERAAIPGIEKGREKTLHIGALILERFLNSVHVLGCFVSVRGWRYAVLDHDEHFSTTG